MPAKLIITCREKAEEKVVQMGVQIFGGLCEKDARKSGGVQPVDLVGKKEIEICDKKKTGALVWTLLVTI
jgi:hypothetical protein